MHDNRWLFEGSTKLLTLKLDQYRHFAGHSVAVYGVSGEQTCIFQHRNK